MRNDLAKVLTERPRHGSRSRNMKTGWHENGYDSREIAEDKYSLPKRGKMKMHNRENGPWDETKEFSDLLGPLKAWVESQVGRNWDKVYSEIKKNIPNTNKQNHHLIDTHLMSYILKNVVVEKTKKGRKVYEPITGRYSWRRGEGKDGLIELTMGEIYVDPDTHVLMRYKKNDWKKKQASEKKAKYTLTGYKMQSVGRDRWSNNYYAPSDKQIADNKFTVYIDPVTTLYHEGESWVYHKTGTETYKTKELDDSLKVHTRTITVNRHTLSKKELIKYGLKEK